MTMTEKRIPTVGERADRMLLDVEIILEDLWRLDIYDKPEDAATELRERVQRWLNSFEEQCRCHRPLRYCNCP